MRALYASLCIVLMSALLTTACDRGDRTTPAPQGSQDGGTGPDLRSRGSGPEKSTTVEGATCAPEPGR